MTEVDRPATGDGAVTTERLHAATPFARTLAIEVLDVDDRHALLRLPARDDLANHVGGPHAGAIFTLGEAAAAVLMLQRFGDWMDRAVPLAVSAAIEWSRLARSSVTAEATADGVADRVRAPARGGGAARVGDDGGVPARAGRRGVRADDRPADTQAACAEPLTWPRAGPSLLPWARRCGRPPSPARTGSGTARRCAGAWTSSSGCSPRTSSTSSDPMTGMEIELNLVDDDGRPAMRNAEVLGRSTTRRSRPSSAGSTSRSTSRRVAGGDGDGRVEDDVREPAQRRPGQGRGAGAGMVMIGILPTLLPGHVTHEALSNNPRYALLDQQILAARGRTCT